MKQALFIMLCIVSLTNAFGQSISLHPNTFQLPKVASNPACTVADKGKVVFNTNQNKIFYCNGSAWIDPENGTPMRITPAFSAYGSSSQVVRSDEYTYINFTSEFFDLGNNFNLSNSPTDPNHFVSLDNGIYEISFNTEFDMSSFAPEDNSQIVFWLSESLPNSYYRSYRFYFPVRDNADQHYIHFSKLLRLPQGANVSLEMKLENAPTFGVLRIGSPNLTGHLVTWY
ncbi:hypothetical protein [Emticicia sp. BO119]|uniref:hypothetical protein n=1 Tax=Emticicia sp. BO119 TaxID=2757768 RepID=UPI0015EFE544|nr:hypothetical protein [Emticicia sp. BO119]MBA4849681.1 hypothetical protein [Emticicia sp. BO119]